MEKASFVQAISKTNLLLTSRKGLFGLYAFLFFFLGLWIDSNLLGRETGDVSSRAVVFVLISYFLYFIGDISLSNFTVASLRSQTSFFPDSPLWGVVRYFLYTLAISLIVGAAFAVGLLLPGIWLALTMDLSSGVVLESVGAPFFLLMIPGALLAVFLVGRWVMALFSAAVGDTYGLTDSWHMTNGYSVKLTLILALGVGLPIGVEIACGAMFNFDLGNPPLLFTLVSNGISAALCLWMNTYLAVLYEDLRERYTVSFQVVPETDPASVAEVIHTPNSQIEKARFTMSDKISPIAVIKEACAIFWARKWSFLGLILLLFVVLTVLQFGSLVGFAPMSDPANLGADVLVKAVVFGLVSLVAMILFSLFVATLLNHLAITHMRGAGRLLPERFLRTMWRVFVRGFILFVTLLVVELVLLAPIILFVTTLSPASGEINLQFVLVMLVYLPVFLFLLTGLMLRLSVMIPGAAVGHVVSLKEAWAMTRGHTWRMIGWYFLLVLVIALVAGLMTAPAFLLGGESFGVMAVILSVGAAVVTLWGYGIMVVSIPVWYERLRLRYESNSAGPEPAMAPESDQSAPQTDVGPYAETAPGGTE
ncbi:hypothetical protein [Pseudodesulfovibrio sediminis]|uniref:Uncharacterized protein n=1 Tax=Pseudodesulfovibrio sediminis TaxID=2810563 RepID=A0ABN6ETF2_9BACT|nr:hypothetical protein [Pseudodesulfovibrio sediminis]BCS88519.1 hypothetical protein PSDVSF_17610 [Pseudodesulfovibrio sediminis]